MSIELNHRHPGPWYLVANVWTTALAASLNMLLILMLLFIVGPKVDSAVVASRENMVGIVKNREYLENARVEIVNLTEETQHFRKVIDRLNAALDANESRLRKAQEDAKKKLGRIGDPPPEIVPAPAVVTARELMPMPSVAVDGLSELIAQHIRILLGVRYILRQHDDNPEVDR